MTKYKIPQKSIIFIGSILLLNIVIKETIKIPSMVQSKFPKDMAFTSKKAVCKIEIPAIKIIETMAGLRKLRIFVIASRSLYFL